MQHNNNGRRHNNNNNRRYKNNNNQNRRYGGGNSSAQKFDDESSNISIQQRKNFANKRDQYLQKAKDALAAGERVDAEGFYQHADHCFRMMNLGLTNGSRFDPVRGMIQNANQQHDNQSDNNENNGDDNNGGSEHNHNHNHNNNHNQNRNQHHSESIDAPQDISSLPFMKTEAPSSENLERRIIE